VSGGLTTVGLRKRFGTVQALDGIDLEVGAGEIVALLGRNGAGKSTLLRILGTTVLPDEGTATVAGYNVADESPLVRRNTGVVLGDERSWYWRLSGRRNLEFFGAMYGLRREAARRRADELLELVQLSGAADRRFDGYSSGMRARLSLARALLVEPPVLLLDEPSRTLDPIVALEFRGILQQMTRDDRRAVLWVTHDLHEAAAIADRIVVMEGGRVVAEQTTKSTARKLERLLMSVVVA
jgi:ABC-2 type transport system ATP-binding protein